MIIKKIPLNLAEVNSYLKNVDENTPLVNYMKEFSKLTKSEAEKISSEVRELNNPKVKEEHIVKIADMVPVDSEDINKIFQDSSLTEEESQAILSIVKKK